jgi:hypothetical protein
MPYGGKGGWGVGNEKKWWVGDKVFDIDFSDTQLIYFVCIPGSFRKDLSCQFSAQCCLDPRSIRLLLLSDTMNIS